MTDEQQDTSNKDSRKPSSNPASGANRGQRRNPTVSKPASSAAQPSKSGNNKKPSGTPATESGSDNGKKANDGKKSEQRRQPQSSAGQGKGNNRRGQSTASQNSRNNNGQSSNKPGTVAAVPPPDSSDALSSLQRVIADLKTTSPSDQPTLLAGNALPTSTSAPIAQTTTSNLPANAPVFQPGASIYPPPSASEPPPRHRKAASMGTAGLSNNFGNFAPHLGSMREDVEDGQNCYEEGEIPESLYSTQPQGHHPRSQSQSFTAPRFAALAAQQEQQQNDILGPSGRPQLAPNFMFGARQRPSMGNIVAPSISEEDAGFQFPQQQTVPSYSDQEVLQRRNDGGGEIRGIMAEQVGPSAI